MDILHLNDPANEYKTWGKNRSNRLKDYDYSTDRPVHITICTQDKKSVFEDGTKAEIIAAELLQSAQDLEYRILCYCLMPNHFHLVISPGNTGLSLSRFLNVFKGRTAAIFRKKFHISGLWQRSAFDHVIRAGEDLKAIVEYILNNPVRKGIVATAGGYPYSKYFENEIRKYL